MQLNITTDYAIRIILCLALHSEFISAQDIGLQMGITKNYVLKIVRRLVKEGLVKGRAGLGGGFVLAKKQEDITLYDIINIMEPTTKVNRCLEEDEYCSRFATATCPVRKFYTSLQQTLDQKLQSITVKGILEG